MGMGYGAFLAMRCDFISQAQMERIMDSADRIWGCNQKIIAKRGGLLCAPVPRGEIGNCGYIQELSFQQVETSIQEYKALCESLPRGGLGVDAHCRDVGLEDPSKVDYCKPEDTIRDLRAENSRLREKLKLAGLGCGDECGCGEAENLEAQQVAK